MPTKIDPDDFQLCAAVPPSLREKIFHMSCGDVAHARLIAFLLNTRHICRETGWVILPRAALAHARGWKTPEHHKTDDVLRDFCTVLGLNFDVDVLPPQRPIKGFAEGRARRVNPVFLRDLRVERWNDMTHDIRKRWVDITTGEAWKPAKRPVVPAVSKSQQRILSYLDSIDRSLYEPTPEALTSAKEMIERESGALRMVLENSLEQLLLQPPRYAPSAARTTERVFAGAWSFLKGDVRRALFPAFVELDFRAMHLAAFEHVCRGHLGSSPALERFSETLGQRDFWGCLLSTFNSPQITKGPIKSLSLAIVNGMGPGVSAQSGGAVKYLHEEHGLDADAVHAALNHQFIQDIFTLSRAIAKHIAKRSHLIDAHGAKRRSPDKSDLLSRTLCSYEALLKNVAIDAVKERPGLRIVFDQHDGFAIHIDGSECDPREAITHVIERVNAHCAGMGFLTELVEKCGE